VIETFYRDALETCYSIPELERRWYGTTLHLGMSVSASGSIRVPRVGPTS
jgi:hypothetical protein